MTSNRFKRKFSFNKAGLTLNYGWLGLGLGLALILLVGLQLDIMDVDAAQYASMALEMTQNGSWLQVQHRGADYLDKPPLVFWVSAMAYQLFGVHNWAYKLPSVLAALLGIYATYRFTLLFYPLKTARQAAFILASSIGLIVICNDIRTDTLLLGMTTCAIWQLAAYLKKGEWPYLIGGFVFAGLAMLAKGPIGLVMPGLAVGTQLLAERRWKDIFHFRWIVGLAVTALVLAPMCWGLYQQFDLQPGKVVNGRTGVSGLYFFFWEQSFGRITGENQWRNDASVFYFLHVYLWAFLPWCLLLPGAWWQRLKTTFSRNLGAAPELYSIGAFTLTFIALSLSKYKLPHYIFITLPWAAVLVAAHLNNQDVAAEKERPAPRLFHWLLLYTTGLVAIIVSVLVLRVVFPTSDSTLWGVFVVLVGMLLLLIYNRTFPTDSDALVQRGVWITLMVGFVMNFYFYPQLLPYQSARSVAEYARAKQIAPEQLAYFHRGSFALDFYNGRYLTQYEVAEDIRRRVNRSGSFWIHADEAGKGELELSEVPFEIEQKFPHFQVALLRPAFLDTSQRHKVVDTIYLLKILPETNDASK